MVEAQHTPQMRRRRMKDFGRRSKRAATPARVISDARIAMGSVGDGQLIPLVIIDLEMRPDVVEMIRFHRHLSPGDYSGQWGQLPNHEDTFALVLQFIRPVDLLLILEFDLNEHMGLIDAIVSAGCRYIQGGTDVDRLSNIFDSPRVLVELGDLGIKEIWEEMLRKYARKRAQSQGFSRQEARNATEDFIREWRAMIRSRLAS
jgi:hypothetical protein